MPKQLNIACWVTVFRLLLLSIALLPVLMQWPYGWLMAASTCAVAGFADMLDDHPAHQKKCVTPPRGRDPLFSLVVYAAGPGADSIVGRELFSQLRWADP